MSSNCSLLSWCAVGASLIAVIRRLSFLVPGVWLSLSVRVDALERRLRRGLRCVLGIFGCLVNLFCGPLLQLFQFALVHHVMLCQPLLITHQWVLLGPGLNLLACPVAAVIVVAAVGDHAVGLGL